jgi:hypothetical protein
MASPSALSDSCPDFALNCSCVKPFVHAGMSLEGHGSTHANCPPISHPQRMRVILAYCKPTTRLQAQSSSLALLKFGLARPSAVRKFAAVKGEV